MNFKNNLENIEYPKSKLGWNIAGTLKGKNGFYKFDTRPLKNNAKGGSFKTKADKIVYDLKDQWIIVDVEELHQYLKEHKIKIINLQDLIFKLDWNIILPK
jgi:hypothetical protein